MPKARQVQVSPAVVRNERDNNFNLLRLLFATLVLVSHSCELIDGDNRREPMVQLFNIKLSLGLLGVAGFFLLSGYLVVESWERRPRLDVFLLKRVLRIYPAFIVASLISMFLVPAFVIDLRVYLREFDLMEYLVSLVALLSPPTIMPLFSPQPFLNGSMWSLAYEFRCYLLVALFGLAWLIRWRNGWLAVTIVLALLACHPALPEWSAAFETTPLLGSVEYSFRLTSLFFVGGSFYLFRTELPLKDLMAAGAAAVLIALLCFDATWQLGLLTSGAYLLFWFAQRKIPLLDPLKRIPDISYGLYLYGWPVQQLLIAKIAGISPIPLFFLALPISAACGYISWHVVEKWFLRLKPKPKVPADPNTKQFRAAVGQSAR